MRLKSLQHDFIQALFGTDPKNAADYVMGDELLTAEQRFGIYKGSVHGILTQALATMFPVCEALVGEEFFSKMCDLFVNKYPPQTSYFSEYGADLPHFLSTFEHVKDIPYITDVARIEWARQTVWHAQESQPVDFSSLAKLSEEQQSRVVFHLSKNMHLIESNYRIDELWFAHQEDSDVAIEDIDINHAVKLIIRKDQGILKVSLMSTEQSDSEFWDFLFALSKGNKLEDLAEQFGESLSEHLNQAIQGAWINSYTTA